MGRGEGLKPVGMVAWGCLGIIREDEILALSIGHRIATEIMHRLVLERNVRRSLLNAGVSAFSRGKECM